MVERLTVTVEEAAVIANDQVDWGPALVLAAGSPSVAGWAPVLRSWGMSP